MEVSGCGYNVSISPKLSLTLGDFLSLTPRALRLYVVRCTLRVFDACATEIALRHRLVPQLGASLERSIDELDSELDVIHGSTYDFSTVYDMADRARSFVKRSFEGFDVRNLAKGADICARFGTFVLTSKWGDLLAGPYDAASLFDYQCISANPGICLADLGDAWPLGQPDLARAVYKKSADREHFFREVEEFYSSDIGEAEQRLSGHHDAAKHFSVLMHEIRSTQIAFEDFQNSRAAARRPDRILHYATCLVLAIRRVGGMLNSMNRSGKCFVQKVETAIAKEYDRSLPFYSDFKAARDAIEHMF